MPFSYILGKCAGDNKFTKSQEKINPLIYMDDIKPLAKYEKELESDANNKNIQAGCKNEVGPCS